MAQTRNKGRSAAIWLGILLLLAFGLRVGFNAEASYDEETGRYLYSGNDPYYHDRTVRYILEHGEHLLFDPAINYPAGANNPNPPLFDWTTAPVAGAMEAAGISTDPVGLALNLMVALWGALTVIPVYMVGRDLWGRRAGLWAAFFMAVSAPHIQRSVFGFADHDATTMFFIALAFAFLVRSLKALDHREYVSDWRHLPAWRAGLIQAVAHNRRAFGWSFLCGAALSATALTWKGYPYALAIMAVAMGLHLLQDHMRNKDSTALFGVYILPLLMVIIVPYLAFYRAAPGFIDTTITPSLYVLMGMVAVGLILVPTRDLPSVLVFPALAVAAIVGLLLLLVVFPDAGRTIFTGLGYFQQSKLYTTIAEAQRTPLGRVAASFGFFTFILAFWGFGMSLRRAWKGDAPHMVMTAWSMVAIFMAFAASRFVMNAAPVFAILIGVASARLVGLAGFAEVRQRFRRRHGQSRVGSAFGALTWKSVGGALLIAVFLVLPNLWTGVDASTSYEYEADHQWTRSTSDRWGAFGLSFDVDDNGWLALFNHLAGLDRGTPLDDRPAFIAWWDYGHWATDLGHHPTVADPFQNNYALAGRFLAAESEQAAVGWLVVHLVDDDMRLHGGRPSPSVQDVLDGHGVAEVTAYKGFEEKMALLNSTIDFGGQEIFQVYDRLVDATGKDIAYFGVDQRMWPQGAGNTGIFYAPVFLANKNPDEFLVTRYSAGENLVLTQRLYGVDAAGDSYQLAEPEYAGSDGKTYVIVGGYAYPKGKVPPGARTGAAEGGLQVGSPSFRTTERFDASMYARSMGDFVVASGAPADGMAHWRAIFEDTGIALSRAGDPIPVRKTVLLEYYRGIVVQGTVEDDAGEPLAGADVTFRDGYGARHASATTDANGTFEVVAPFAVDGDLTLEVRRDDVTVAERVDDVQFTRAQARNGHIQPAIRITVERGAVEGVVFEDVDGAPGFNGTTDRPVADARVSLGGRNVTTTANGTYAFPTVQAGSRQLQVTKEGYDPVGVDVVVRPGEHTWSNQSLRPSASAVTLVVSDVPEGTPVNITGPMEAGGGGPPQQPRVDAEGNATASLRPGTYRVVIDHVAPDPSGLEGHYAADEEIVVPFGGEPHVYTIAAGRTGPTG